MKILLISGHGAGDPGALGCGYQEATITIEVMELLATKLVHAGLQVTKYPAERNAYKDIQNGQWQVGWDFDYVLEIHFNAGGGQGTEIYVTTKEKQTTVEQVIVNKIASIGYKNRGVKATNFLVITTCKNHTISSALLETCFIDNLSDMQLYASHKEQIVQAITDGIVEGFGLSNSKEVPPSISKPLDTEVKATYTGSSIVEYLNSKGKDSSFNHRKQLALQNGIVSNKEDYIGTSEQNLALLKAMRSTIEETNTYYSIFTNASIVDGLKAIGVDSSFLFRNKIAIKNGITNYSGTAEQNRLLCELGKQGKLKRV